MLSTEPLLTDDELIQDVMNDENVDDCDDNDDCVLDPICLKVSDVRDALQVLRDSCYSANGGEIHRSINSHTAILESDFTALLTQSEILCIFM